MIRADTVCGILTAGLFLAGCVGCAPEDATSAQLKQSSTNAQAGQNGQDDLVSVRTLLPERTSLSRTTTQPAIVHAYYQAEVYAKASGYLEELNVDIGQEVEAGTVLGTIAVPEMVKSREKQEATIRRLQADEKRAAAEITVAEANLESAKAALQQARADVSSADAHLRADRIEYERVKELVENNAVAESLRDEALMRYESAEAAKLAVEAAVVSANAGVGVAGAKLEAAGADLAAARAITEVALKELEELDVLMSYAILRSPFKGVVTQRNVDPGDLIRNAPASSGPDSPPLFVIEQVDEVRVRVPVPERDAPWATVGDPADLTFQALPGRTFAGTVSRISDCLDESTRTLAVEIDLDNPGHKLLPGLFGEATILVEEHPDSLVLPAGAVRYDETGNSYVYAIDPAGRVQVVDVTTGLDDGHLIEITNGLTGDERVADAMIGRLKPGQEVRVQEQ